MKPSPEFIFWYRVLAAGAIVYSILAWFVIRRPALLKALTGWEFIFWSRLVSPAFAEKQKRFSERVRMETIVKVIIVATAVVSLAGFLFFSVWLVRPR